MYYDLQANLDYLVLLVMQNKAEKVIDLIDSGRFNQNLLEDIGCCESSLPLYKLSLCNAILLDSGGWSKEVLPIVERNRLGCKNLLDYWAGQWKCPINVPLDFETYQSECAHFKDGNMEDLLGGNLNELIALGYDENEVEFCYAVLTYKYDLIQKHIKMRTNPDIYISGTIPFGYGNLEDGESYNALDCYNIFYCDAFDCYGLRAFWSDIQIREVRVRDVHLLLEAAAYCDLEKKLQMLK